MPRVSTQNAILATIFIDRPRPDVSAESFGTVLEFLAKSEMQFWYADVWTLGVYSKYNYALKVLELCQNVGS